ncbi:unnamed protein product, partial [Prorocentrum cordatum]
PARHACRGRDRRRRAFAVAAGAPPPAPAGRRPACGSSGLPGAARWQPGRPAAGHTAPATPQRKVMAMAQAAPPAPPVDCHRVDISEDRLGELLGAELAVLSGQVLTPLSLRQVLDANTPHKAAELMRRELPKRFAHRIRQIEEWPGWQDVPELEKLHELYFCSFRESFLRQCDGTSPFPFTPEPAMAPPQQPRTSYTMCPTPSCRAGKQWDWNWRIIKNGGACSVCGQTQQLYSPRKKKDKPKGGSPKGPGPAVPAASSPAIFSPWGKAKLINQLEALVQQDASVTASVLAIKQAVETPALPRSRTPLEQLQSTEAKAKQAATNAHNFLSEISNLETRLKQARQDYDQAMEELVDAEEAHEAAVLAYNNVRGQTASEVKPESVPDFLAAYEDKLKSISIEEYEDGEAKDKLQTALTAMDEAKDQAAAVIHAVQTALEGVKLAAAQAPLKRRRVVEVAAGPEATASAVDAEGSLGPATKAEGGAEVGTATGTVGPLRMSAWQLLLLALAAVAMVGLHLVPRSELRGISDIGVGTFDLGLRQPPAGPLFGDGGTSEARGIVSSVQADSVDLEPRHPPSGPLFGGGGTCEPRGIFSDSGVVVSDLVVRQPPPGPLYGGGDTSELRGIVSSVEVGPFDLETRHPPSGPLFGDGGTSELRGIFSSTGVGSVGSEYRHPPSGPLLGDGGTTDIGVGAIYFGVWQPPSGPLYGDGGTSELRGIVSSDGGVTVYYGEWQPPSGPLFGDGDTGELRGVSRHTVGS